MCPNTATDEMSCLPDTMLLVHVFLSLDLCNLTHQCKSIKNGRIRIHCNHIRYAEAQLTQLTDTIQLSHPHSLRQPQTYCLVHHAFNVREMSLVVKDVFCNGGLRQDAL